MKKYIFFIATLCLIITSCTLDKTDYEAEINTEVTEYFEFEEALTISSATYKVSIETLNASFFKGYNEIHLKIIDTQTNESVKGLPITFLPILTDANGNKSSCPHLYNLEYNEEEAYYKGYVVFTSESDTTNNWQLYIDLQDEEVNTLNEVITVESQTNMNLNMTAFTGNDDEQYFIALIAPQSPGVSENDLVAGIYKYNQPTTSEGEFPDLSQYSYSKVEGYTLYLDPRMPEPSMGNHSSPNNQDLTQGEDGLYYGVVNYTMTGNWTLNFIFKNENGELIKGTEVSTDFTPGIEGEKSELYIDILF
ncbi:hypothetical protein SAMN04488096_10159 [Mesonia phycicola]|uniref:YtkA-like n=1 Tax=Mesonia phycicola TaxID=579105 RepID=A0A1M6A4U0_9FLAO|nr:hypothetical protein [Mesonia phycicola]SHI31183.1 hypothetical protein SAMN04488096_10159 [Mesonia phycicola]